MLPYLLNNNFKKKMTSYEFDMTEVMHPDNQWDLSRHLEEKKTNWTKAALTVQGGNTEYIVWELATVSTCCNLFTLLVIFRLQ